MPHGKPAGIPCIHLTAERRCALFGKAERPDFCVGLQPSVGMCGSDRPSAMELLYTLEVQTSPTPSSRPLLCRDVDPSVLPGVARDVVVMAPHEGWAAVGHHVCQVLSHVVPEGATVEHIGSTAVPGLPAKPIVDVLVECTSFDDLAPFRPALEALGGRWCGESGIVGRRYVSFADADGRSYVHVHCFETGHPALDDHRRFRTILCASAEARALYADAKRSLAVRHIHDRAAYTTEKGAVVERILATGGATAAPANL